MSSPASYEFEASFEEADPIDGHDFEDNPSSSSERQKYVIRFDSFSYAVKQILEFAILFFVLYNIGQFVLNAKYSSTKINTRLYINRFFQHERRDPSSLPPFTDKIEYTEEELNQAITNLGLPTWSRAYVHCSDPKSEITCPQIIKAWRAIHAWELNVSQKGIKDDNHPDIIHTFTKRGGIGNRVMQESVAAVIGMVMNRAVSVECISPRSGRKKSSTNPYTYPASGTIFYTTKGRGGCYKDREHVGIRGDGDFYWHNFNDLKRYEGKHLDMTMVFLSSMMYLHPTLSAFCREHFGLYGQYFVMNYVMRIPDNFINEAKSIVQAVPENVRLFGVHLRFHQEGYVFCRNIQSALDVALPFMKAQQQYKPTEFVFASDNQKLFDEFKSRINFLYMPVHHQTDGDHLQAFREFTLLMMCSEFLLTCRSTWSCLVSMRNARRCWMFEKDATEIYLLSNSQVSYQQNPFPFWNGGWKQWELNALANMHSHQIEAIRYYYRYMTL